MATRLTADEEAFLKENATRRGRADRSTSTAGRRRSHRPRLPVKTMIAIAVVALLVCVTAQGVFSAAEPYVNLTSTDDWSTLSDNSGDLTSSDKAYVDSINEVSGVWKYRSVVYVVIIVLTVLVELGLYLQWSVRLSSWERKRGSRRKKSKKSIDRSGGSAGSAGYRAGYRIHTESHVGQRFEGRLHAGRYYVNIRPDDARRRR